MLFAIDVGNTTITFAVFEGDKLRADWRVGTVARRTGDEYAALMLTLFKERGLCLGDIDAVAISSVVPATVDALVRLSKRHLNVPEPLVLSPGMDVGMKLNYSPIADVGADRIADAVAAHAIYGGKIIIVDFGTAITIEAVSEDGEFLGGAIAPGVQVSLEALFARAARLTRMRFVAPEKAIGDTTESSLQSGIVFGYAGQVDALVDRFQEEMGGGARVIATGGIAEEMAVHSRTIECVDEMLTLQGLRIIYERTRS